MHLIKFNTIIYKVFDKKLSEDIVAMSYNRLCVALLGLIGVCFGSANGDENLINFSSFSWSTCSNATYPTTVSYLKLYPDPVVVPGQLMVDAYANATRDINSPAKIVLSFERKVLEEWVLLPCIVGHGSGDNCTVDDICQMMTLIYPPDQPCPDSLALHGVACHCPITAGIYDIRGFTINIFLHIPGIVSGDYHLKLAFYSDDVEITCFDVWFTLLTK